MQKRGLCVKEMKISTGNLKELHGHVCGIRACFKLCFQEVLFFVHLPLLLGKTGSKGQKPEPLLFYLATIFLNNVPDPNIEKDL